MKDAAFDELLSSGIHSSLMFFFVFVILTVLSQYVSRIMSETIERPLYFVRSELTSSVLPESEANIVNESVDA